MKNSEGAGDNTARCLVIVSSYHHNNTAKVAYALSETLHAEILSPEQVIPGDLADYDLIGFGAGIDSGRHYKPLLDLAERLPVVGKKACFIFSTSAVQSESKVDNDHKQLRQMLVSKGYKVVGEFSCKGYNTNSFLKFVGGMNRGRPNREDLMNAKEFASGFMKG